MGYSHTNSGDDIYAESFRIIRKEADLSKFSPTLEPIAVRMIHGCGQTDLCRIGSQYSRHPFRESVLTMSRSYDEAAAHPRQLRGRLSAIGVGPGDSELLTVKAVRALQAADVVADHQAPGRLSHALRTVTPYLDHQRLLALEYPVATGPTSHPEGYQGALAEFYDTAERLLRAELAAGKTVALIAAGDPLIYSSQQHLSRRLTGDYPVDIISGISSFQAAAAATRSVLCEDRDVFRVVPATLPLAELTAQLCSGDPLAVLKLGRTTDTLVSALRAVDRLEHALVVSFASTPHEQIIPLTEALSKGGLLPYFSVVLLPSATLADGVVREENAPAEERVDVVGLGPGTPNFSPRTRRIFSPKLLMWWATPPIHNESR